MPGTLLGCGERLDVRGGAAEGITLQQPGGKVNDAIRNGATMHEIREFAGHADIRTTEVYFVRKEGRRRGSRPRASRSASRGARASEPGLERLRREVMPPIIFQDAGANAEYADADFFKDRIGNPNTRKAYKDAVDRISI